MFVLSLNIIKRLMTSGTRGKDGRWKNSAKKVASQREVGYRELE